MKIQPFENWAKESWESHVLPNPYILFCVFECHNWFWLAASIIKLALMWTVSVMKKCWDLDEMALYKSLIIIIIIIIICDPIWVNETDVVHWLNVIFADNICFMSVESFWHQNYSFIIFHSRVMRKSKLLSCDIRNWEVQVSSP